jgi:serine/threonine-protein kinase RsbW
MRITVFSEQSKPTAGGGATPAGFGRLYREVRLRRSEEMAPLLDELVDALTGLDYAACDRVGLRLALEEAIINGLRHGNHGDPTKCVRVRYHIGPEAVLAEVEDEGLGFDPASVPDPTASENLEKPSGRGLALMRHYTTWLCYHGHGNRLTLCKYRPRR